MNKNVLMNVLILVLCTVSILLISCSKKEDTAPPIQTAAVQEEMSSQPVEKTGTPTVSVIGAEGFNPSQLTIAHDDTVIFSNDDPRKKDMVLTFQFEDSRKFVNSKVIKPSQTFEKEFIEPGVYYYWTQSYAARAKITVE